MNKSIFGYSFDKKPDPRQWTILRNQLPPSYELPDTEMLANLHRSNVPAKTLSVQDWLKDHMEIRGKEEAELSRVLHLLPEGYVIPDVIRLKNILTK